MSFFRLFFSFFFCLCGSSEEENRHVGACEEEAKFIDQESKEKNNNLSDEEMRASGDDDTIYHERQTLQRCALHAVNSLFQRQEFERYDFDEIARSLSPGKLVCPHKSVFGTGNYDVNVIMAALSSKNKRIEWWDRRKDPEEIPFDGIFGLIVNRQTRSLKGLWKSKHWIGIHYRNGKFFNCDSNLPNPRKLKNKEELFEFLRKEIEGNGEVLRIYNN